MNRHGQRGGSALAAVMLLLAMGLMLLTAQQRQLDNALLLAADQQRYLVAYNQAASALNWGMVQPWPVARLTVQRWHCLRHLAELQVCGKMSVRAGIVVLRGQGTLAGDRPLWLYQLAMPDDKGKLAAVTGGRLDFCPEKNEADCAD
ncbi:YgdB family protein [Serratia sp. AKBS12]|uniref:YgdB family protein n=1 Tax=Serratia sp. AKBS12 TaxID=2974597 RepID=UPI002165C0EA|nr:YgdB family protein [Serratia sp. AKBS12]MCS3407353.1 YgdB family protein [Serratia sp. AKBS12]